MRHCCEHETWCSTTQTHSDRGEKGEVWLKMFDRLTPFLVDLWNVSRDVYFYRSAGLSLVRPYIRCLHSTRLTRSFRYLSTTAIFLNVSWSLHNVIAWMKNKPFLSRKGSLFYIITVALVQPYWVLEIVANVPSPLSSDPFNSSLTSNSGSTSATPPTSSPTPARTKHSSATHGGSSQP